MNQRRSNWPAGIGLLLLATSIDAADAAQPLAAQLDSYMTARADLGHFSGSAYIAKSGEVLLSKGYGFADAAKTEPNTPDTVYHAASLTKQFAAMAVMILQERRLLSTSDHIADRLEGAPETWRDITIRHLLMHTSGIPDYESELVMDSPAYTEFMTKPNVAARILAAAKEKPLRFEPGTQFEYSNTGYIVLGFIIERAAGVPFNEFLQREIFQPLDMTHSAHDRGGLTIDHRARGYTLAEQFSFKKLFAGYSFPADFTAAPKLSFAPPQADSALITTTLDLARWDRALADGKLVTRVSMDEMFTPGLANYAYGWIVDGEPGKRRQWHTGVLPGFISRIERYPDERFTIILLANTSLGLDRIAADLAAICRAQPVTLPVRRTIIDLKPPEYQPLLGRYVDDQGRTLEVEHDGEMVTVGLKGKFVSGLLAESPCTFFSVMFNGPVRFETDKQGRVSEIVMQVKGQEWRAKRTKDE
ncbi:MAG TPA: serine hydrolase domain-containing protein [Phycisphaerales bacterium]|nr:serine hydrolase domain-containing protein [Phycisphaerales bacterium]